jgi:hypothetical protein
MLTVPTLTARQSAFALQMAQQYNRSHRKSRDRSSVSYDRLDDQNPTVSDSLRCAGRSRTRFEREGGRLGEDSSRSLPEDVSGVRFPVKRLRAPV